MRQHKWQTGEGTCSVSGAIAAGCKKSLFSTTKYRRLRRRRRQQATGRQTYIQAADAPGGRLLT